MRLARAEHSIFILIFICVYTPLQSLKINRIGSIRISSRLSPSRRTLTGARARDRETEQKRRRAATRMFRGAVANAKIGRVRDRIVKIKKKKKPIRLNFCDFSLRRRSRSVPRVCDCASDKRNRSDVVARRKTRYKITVCM